MQWLGDVFGAALPAGVSYVDQSAVRVILPTRLDSLKQTVERGRVLFDPGSAELQDASAAGLPAVAAAFRRLAEGVNPAVSVGLELVGRTDFTGSDQSNQALAQWRIDKVMARLVSSGVVPGALAGKPMATSQPLRVANADEQARINRSVSFNVIVRTGPRAPRRQ